MLLGWHVVIIIASLGAGRLLETLFAAWGVNAGNILLYPKWVQYLAAYQTQLFFAISAAIAALGGYLLRRHTGGDEPDRVKRVLGTGIGFFSGIFAAAALAILFLMVDSMRLESFELFISPDIPIVLIVSLLIGIAEAQLAFGYVRAMANQRGGRTAGFVCAAIMYVMMEGSYLSGIIVTANAVLGAVVMCLIAEKLGAGAAAGLKTGWLWTSTALISFGGSGMLTMYPVSEQILTGGGKGPEAGLLITLFIVVILWFSIGKPAFNGFKNKIKEAKVKAPGN